MKYYFLLAILLFSNITKGQNQNNVFVTYNDKDTCIIINEPNGQVFVARSIIVHSPDIKSDCFLSKKKNGSLYVSHIINLKNIPEFLSFDQLCIQYHLNKADQKLPFYINGELNTDPHRLIADKKSIKTVKLSLSPGGKPCIAILLINPPPGPNGRPDNL